jgi:hypothetical protein
MAKIRLKSIQNNSINQVKPKTKQKPVKNVEIHAPKQCDNIVIKQPESKPTFNDILTSLQKNVVENKENLVNAQPANEFQNNIQKKNVEVKPLLEHERNKVIGLLLLYISEFPDKLKSY